MKFNQSKHINTHDVISNKMLKSMEQVLKSLQESAPEIMKTDLIKKNMINTLLLLHEHACVLKQDTL